MQIVFINYGKYCVSSGVHIHFIANVLRDMGHDCTVVLPTVEDSCYFGTPDYKILSYETFVEKIIAGAYSSETILHAWTPREQVRTMTLMAAKALQARYFVHLEDNERYLLETQYKKPFAELVRLTAKGELNASGHLCHPILHQAFIAEAAGVSFLMDRLEEFIPPHVPRQLIWPACEEDFFAIPQRRSMALRRHFGIPDEASVLVYPGNVHYANAATMAPLYHALPLIEARRHTIRLIRCAGSDHIFADAEIPALRERYVMDFSNTAPTELPTFLRMADVLVQPGTPDAFDDYRFPSKLPLFLASARPVVLPRTNIGAYLTDGHNCRHLEVNTPEAIAGHVADLLEHPGTAAHIGQNGRAFAREHFSWRNTAQKLLDFYTPAKPE